MGKNIFLAFCPERICEGKAYNELRTLPQIIGSEDLESDKLASELFSKLSQEILHTNYINAELTKLVNNIYRYTNFALANQFALIADSIGANIYETRRLANHNYPRCDLALPGLAAGTCLRKDFGMLNEWNPYPDILLAAWKMNEYTPAMLVSQLSKRIKLHNKRVTILGYTFKADTDDIRDSLVPKLYRYINRELPMEIRISEKNLSNPIEDDIYNITIRNWSERDALSNSDAVFIATDHSGYTEIIKEFAIKNQEVWIADIWNVGKANKIFYKAKEILK